MGLHPTHLASIALGLTAATKLAMLPSVATVALYLVVGALRTGRRREIAAAAAAFTVVVAPWWARNYTLYGNPIYPAALPFIGRGLAQSAFPTPDLASVPGAAWWPLYPLLEPHASWSGFGALFVVGAVPGIAAAACGSDVRRWRSMHCWLRWDFRYGGSSRDMSRVSSSTCSAWASRSSGGVCSPSLEDTAARQLGCSAEPPCSPPP
jgi:hypothetical protein